MSGRIRLKGLVPEAFQHPLDKAATRKLEKTPGLNLLAEKIMELGFEQAKLVELMGNSLQVSRSQLSSIYDVYQEACNIMDLPQPDLFIENNPFPNAYTLGKTKPVIAVTSGLIKDFTKEEIMFILGHELGHVKCGHSYYNLIAACLQLILTAASDVTLGIGNLVSSGLKLALLEWSRKAEFSADRAGLLAVQNVEVATTALSKLLAPGTNLWKEVNMEEVMRQAQRFEELSDNKVTQIHKLITGLQIDHPWVVLRVKELNQWALDGHLQNVLTLDEIDFIELQSDIDYYTPQLQSNQFQQSNYLPQETLQPQRQPRIQATQSSGTKYCINCGAVISRSAKFCIECGQTQN